MSDVNQLPPEIEAILRKREEVAARFSANRDALNEIRAERNAIIHAPRTLYINHSRSALDDRAAEVSARFELVERNDAALSHELSGVDRELFTLENRRREAILNVAKAQFEEAMNAERDERREREVEKFQLEMARENAEPLRKAPLVPPAKVDRDFDLIARIFPDDWVKHARQMVLESVMQGDIDKAAYERLVLEWLYYLVCLAITSLWTKYVLKKKNGS